MADKQLINTNSIDSFRAKLIEVVNTGIDNSLTVDNIKFDVAQMRAELDAFGLTPEQVVTINSLLELIAQAEETEAIEAVVAQLASKANVDDLIALQLQVNALPTKQDLDLKANQSALDLKANKTELDKKQDKLTAGTNVTIDGSNKISVTLPEAEAVAFANITGAAKDNASLSTELDTLQTNVNGKQNKLTAGAGITIINDTISSSESSNATVESMDNVFGSPAYDSGKVDFSNMNWAQQITQADVTGYQNNKYRTGYITSDGTKNGPHGTSDYGSGIAVLHDFYNTNFAKGSQIVLESRTGGAYFRTRSAIGGWTSWKSMFPSADTNTVTAQAITLGDGSGTLDYTRVRHELWATNGAQYELNGFITVTAETTAAVTSGVTIDAVANYAKLANYSGTPFRTKVWSTSTGEDVGMITATKSGIVFTSFKALPVGEYAFDIQMTIVA